MYSRSHTLLPAVQVAIVQDENGAPRLAEGIPLPPLNAGTVMVRTMAVALNPSDHKMGAAFPTPGAVIGLDFSGIVAAIHPDTKTDLRVGDAICGMVHGSNPSDPANGAFAEYVRVRPELLLRIPDQGTESQSSTRHGHPHALSMEQAATLGVGLLTNALALWDSEGLALDATPDKPWAHPHPVLVYGGSTATGTLATQLLRLSGLRPITTCSSRNAALVQARGVAGDDIIDYVVMSADTVVGEIKKRLLLDTTDAGKLRHAYDCVADLSTSVPHCYAALARTGGRYVSLEMVPEEARTRRAVRYSFVLAYAGLGDAVSLPRGYGCAASSDKFALAVRCFAMFQRLLDRGDLKTHPVQKVEGDGWAAVLKGLELLKSGVVSGTKLVVTLSS